MPDNNLLAINPVRENLKSVDLSVADLVISHNIDVLVLTEDWLGTCNDAQVLSVLLSPGYDIQLGT